MKELENMTIQELGLRNSVLAAEAWDEFRVLESLFIEKRAKNIVAFATSMNILMDKLQMLDVVAIELKERIDDALSKGA